MRSSPICCQTTTNHSNLGILGAMAYTLFIKCIRLTTLGHVKSAGRGAYAHAAKKTFFFNKRYQCHLFVLSEGGLQCNASVSGLSHTAWWLALAVDQTVAVSCNHL